MDDLYSALLTLGYKVLKAKGGFFVQGEGFKSLSWARKVTAIATPKRKTSEQHSPYGDYAWLAAFNRIQ